MGLFIAPCLFIVPRLFIAPIIAISGIKGQRTCIWLRGGARWLLMTNNKQKGSNLLHIADNILILAEKDHYEEGGCAGETCIAYQ